MKFFIFIFLLLVLIFSLLYSNFNHADINFDSPQIVSSIIVLILLLSGMITRRHSFSKLIVDFSAWVGIFIVIIFFYSYRDNIKSSFSKFVSNVIPSKGIKNIDGSVTFSLSNNNHFMVDAFVNGVKVRFLLDTGATRVVLSYEDAKKIGFNVDSLKFSSPVQTANGITHTALINIEKIEIEHIMVSNIPASISKNNLGTSLLGMSFLQKLKNYNISGSYITLYN